MIDLSENNKEEKMTNKQLNQVQTKIDNRDTLIVDTREPLKNQEYTKELCKERNINYELKTLNVADYIYTTTNGQQIAFERKTLSDFISSKTFSNRLALQISQLIEKYSHNCLIIESGYVPKKIRRFYIPAQKSMNSLSFIIPVIRTTNYKTTIENIFHLATKLKKGELGVLKVTPIITKINDPIIEFLCGLPETNIQTAKLIKDNFDTLEDFTHNCERLIELKLHDRRITERAKKIIEFIRQKWKNKHNQLHFPERKG